MIKSYFVMKQWKLPVVIVLQLVLLMTPRLFNKYIIFRKPWICLWLPIYSWCFFLFCDRFRGPWFRAVLFCVSTRCPPTDAPRGIRPTLYPSHNTQVRRKKWPYLCVGKLHRNILSCICDIGEKCNYFSNDGKIKNKIY